MVNPVMALLMLVLAVAVQPAAAHFTEGTKVRTIIVATGEAGGSRDGLVAYVRTPMPLLFADVVRTARADARPLDTPFLYFEMTGAGERYRFSLDALAARRDLFRERLSRALVFAQSGKDLAAEVLSFRVLARDPGSGFGSASEARASVGRSVEGLDPVFGDAVVELALSIDAPVPLGPVQVRTGLPELPLPDGVEIDNQLIDDRSDRFVAYVRPGQLAEPATVDGSTFRVAVEFVWQGVVHILEGLDHVLLVVCLALGAGATGRPGAAPAAAVDRAAVARLAWLVTAFTLGHSVTLIASFLGATPSAAWFIPAVEAAIAATVLLAAVAGLTGWMRESRETVAVIAAVGLLHGLGFSFVLGEILGRDAPHLVPALAAFNLGIELGQLVILAATLAIVWGLSRTVSRVLAPARAATLGGIALVAAWWVLERAALS